MAEANLVYIADVFCPWCYGFAPIMRRIAAENPQFPVSVIGGNLISNPITLQEDVEASPGLINFWHEVEKTTGSSLEGAINAAETGRMVRLYSPGADQILVTLKEFAPNHELEQLFELEEMFYGEGRDMFNEPALEEIANHWGVSLKNFEKALDQPGALAATEENLRMQSELMGEITSYPSVLLVRDGKVDAVSRGYVHYETVESRLQDAIRDLGLEDMAGENCSWQNGCTVNRHSRR